MRRRLVGRRMQHWSTCSRTRLRCRAVPCAFCAAPRAATSSSRSKAPTLEYAGGAWTRPWSRALTKRRTLIKRNKTRRVIDADLRVPVHQVWRVRGHAENHRSPADPLPNVPMQSDQVDLEYLVSTEGQRLVC